MDVTKTEFKDVDSAEPAQHKSQWSECEYGNEVTFYVRQTSRPYQQLWSS
jgi:hypothetical protein